MDSIKIQWLIERVSGCFFLFSISFSSVPTPGINNEHSLMRSRQGDKGKEYKDIKRVHSVKNAVFRTSHGYAEAESS